MANSPQQPGQMDLTKKGLAKKPPFQEPKFGQPLGGQIPTPPSRPVAVPPPAEEFPQEEPEESGSTGFKPTDKYRGFRDQEKKAKEGKEKTGQKPSSPAAEAAKKEAVETGEKQLEKAGLARLLGSLTGPVGAVISWLAPGAIDWLKKNWQTILLVMGALAVLLVIIAGFALLHRSFGGSTLKEPVSALAGALDVLNLRARGGKDVVEKFTAEKAKLFDQTITALKNQLDKENSQVRGSKQKEKISQLLDKYQKQINTLKDLVNQVTSQNLNTKKEQDLSKEEFAKRNELYARIDQIYLESEQIRTELEKELNRCDRLGNIQPNSLGLYYLEDNDNHQKFVAAAGNKSLRPWYGTGMTICFVKALAEQWKTQTGQKLWVGEISRQDLGPIMDYGLGEGHRQGTSMVLSGPQIVPRSATTFKDRVAGELNYNQEKAKQFANLLWQLGAGQVYLEEEKLNSQTTTNIFGENVPLATYAAGLGDHWQVSMIFPAEK